MRTLRTCQDRCAAQAQQDRRDHGTDNCWLNHVDDHILSLQEWIVRCRKGVKIASVHDLPTVMTG